MATSDDKARLREALKQLRLEVNAEQSRKAAQAVAARIAGLLENRNITRVHSYLPIARLGEIDSLPALRQIFDMYPDVRCATPVSCDRRQLRSQWLSPGTLDLTGQQAEDSVRYDVIIVPLLGFDDAGYRLGYGGGYYDAFLATQPGALTIGVGYEFGRQQTWLPREPHDVALSCVVTEEKLHAFTS